MWPLLASLHPLSPPSPLPLPLPTIIINTLLLNNQLCAWSLPHRAPPLSHHVPAQCTPSTTTSIASPPTPPALRLPLPYPPGHPSRRCQRIGKCPSLTRWCWPAAMTSRPRTAAAAAGTRVTAATRAARKVGVHV